MHITDDQLVAHYYGELSGDAEAHVTAHLESCGACRTALSRLKRVMAAIDAVQMPEPAAGFDSRVWSRLKPEIAVESARQTRDRWSSSGAWKVGAWGTMAAGLMFAAFLAGRMWPATTAPTRAAAAPVASPASDDSVRERVLLVDLSDHFDRTEQALVEFVSRGNIAGDSDEQARSEDLVAANRLYRGTVEASGDRAVTDVLDDLERVLIEIAGVPSNAPPAELDAIRKRIDARDLLFKLRVMRMELEQRASDPRPVKRQGPTT